LSFFCAGEGENKKLSFQRKRQRRDNCCPSEAELNANEVNQIEADRPRKGGGDTNSAEKERKVKD